MKNTLKILASVAAAMIASVSSADYISAMVRNAQLASDGSLVYFDYVTVTGNGDTDYLYFYTPGASSGIGQMYASDPDARNYSYGAVGSATEDPWSFFVGYDSGKNYTSFLFELWLGTPGAAELVGQKQFSMDALKAQGAITYSTGVSGGTNPAIISQVTIPEPTGALLVAIGLAALALRRRKQLKSGGEHMKKPVIFAFAALVATIAVAAQNDLLISFSTPGPDKYADGTTVLDGECYALVWTPAGAVNATIAADGTTSGGMEIVLAAPVARKGKCPNVVYRIDADRVATEFVNGSWSVYLLDTRRYAYDEEGNQVVTVAGVDNSGAVRLVNAAGQVGGASVSAKVGESASLKTAVAATASAGTVLPDDVPQPVVSGIEIVGGNVFVTVENAAAYLTYDLDESAAPNAAAQPVDNPATGGADGKVILVAPVKQNGAGFFRVRRHQP